MLSLEILYQKLPFLGFIIFMADELLTLSLILFV